MTARRAILGAILGTPIARFVSPIKETKPVTINPTPPESGMDPMPTFPLLGLLKYPNPTNNTTERKIILIANRQSIMVSAYTDDEIKNMIYRRYVHQVESGHYFTLTDSGNVITDAMGIYYYNALKGYSGERSLLAF